MTVFYTLYINNICILFFILLNVKYKLKFSQFSSFKTSTYLLIRCSVTHVHFAPTSRKVSLPTYMKVGPMEPTYLSMKNRACVLKTNSSVRPKSTLQLFQVLQRNEGTEAVNKDANCRGECPF